MGGDCAAAEGGAVSEYMSEIFEFVGGPLDGSRILTDREEYLPPWATRLPGGGPGALEYERTSRLTRDGVRIAKHVGPPMEEKP